jgi:hypothetical protein
MISGQKPISLKISLSFLSKVVSDWLQDFTAITAGYEEDDFLVVARWTVDELP